MTNAVWIVLLMYIDLGNDEWSLQWYSMCFVCRNYVEMSIWCYMNCSDIWWVGELQMGMNWWKCLFQWMRFVWSVKWHSKYELHELFILSLYTVTPHQDGKKALKFFLDKCLTRELSTTVLVGLAELVLTFNHLFFDGKHYQQISGVAMGTKISCNYANLFVGFEEKQIYEHYTSPLSDYLGRYIDGLCWVGEIHQLC